MDKIKKIFSKAWVKCSLTGIICLFIGVGMGGSSTSDLEAKNKDLTDNNAKLEMQVKDLQTKVNEAKPYFEMAQVEKEKLEEQAKEEEAKKQKEKAEKEAAEKQAVLDAKSVTLSSGKYEAGKDFEVGKYNLVAVKGGGNVICNDNGLNAIMGIKENEMFGDMYEKEYKNITFKKGQILNIDRVTIKLVPVE